MMSREDAEFLSKWNEHTPDLEFNYISNQHCLAKIWLKHIRKCKCKLDQTSGDCRHIRKALKKLHGKQIDKIWNDTLKQRIESFSKVYDFKIPFSLEQRLSA